MTHKNNDLILYYSDTIHMSNRESSKAILCLWTKKDRIIEKLSPENYCFIGQLYSKEYGLQILVRNLLGTTQIRDLIVTGIDLNGSSEGLIKLFEEGIDQENKIIGTDIYLDKAITKKHIEELRKRVTMHDFRNIKDFSILDEEIRKISDKKPLGEKIILALPENKPPIRYPTDFSGYKARGQNFYDAYKNLISYMLRFGYFDPEKKKLIVANVTFFVKTFNDKDKEFLASRKDTMKTKSVKVSFPEQETIVVQVKEIDAWDELKYLVKEYREKKNLSVMIGTVYIDEKNLEDAVEMIDNSDNRRKWDPDSHGNIVIRVEGGKIKVMQINQQGKLLDEFEGLTAKELYRKIAEENRISMIYHALDIGAELQKAEIALREGKKYEQDKN